jgi:hypothetical protein
MMKMSKRSFLINGLILLLLALVFSAYLRPEMMIDMANTLLTLCGW